MGWSFNLGLKQYGPVHREQRRLLAVGLSQSGVRQWDPIVEVENMALMKRLLQQPDDPMLEIAA